MTDHNKHFQALQAADRRLCVLRFLDTVAGHKANNYVLQSVLDGFGHAASRELIAQDLQFLDEIGAVTVSTYDSLTSGTLTAKGQDVARGLAVVNGVKQPIGG